MTQHINTTHKYFGAHKGSSRDEINFSVHLPRREDQNKNRTGAAAGALSNRRSNFSGGTRHFLFFQSFRTNEWAAG